ncbi:MAG TPA: Na+/H+ antiporter NhaA [Nocardioidaceae bacterium]|nr:Na+/H+ antiporter NhaA [Nocardioidaceae bacterium]
MRLGRRRADDEIWRTGPTFIASDRTVARYVARPMADFLRIESAGGVLLVLAAVVAMVWANSAWSDSYAALWQTEINVEVGSWRVSEDLQHWVNDALMVIFFFVVGLEIKYEIVAGHLRDPKAASLPIIAAFGGMAVPALLYFLIAGRGEGSAGWGIPMATDIAFAVGVLGLLGRRIPAPARIFLLTLAIVDDIGAITVIAVFYTEDLSFGWLALAAAAFLGVVLLRRLRVWSIPVYVVVGVFAWFATYQSGVHATVAGVLLGLLTPAKSLLDEKVARQYARRALEDDRFSVEELGQLRFLLRESAPMVVRLQSTLHPFSSYVVLPIFALANAGIALGGGVLPAAMGSEVTMGVAAGLLFGKVIGITSASWLATKLGLGRLPHRTGWTMMTGLGLLGGVGFTVSLFIAGLSFPGEEQLVADAKVGILGTSVLAAVVGALFLLLTTRSAPERDTTERAAD